MPYYNIAWHPDRKYRYEEQVSYGWHLFRKDDSAIHYGIDIIKNEKFHYGNIAIGRGRGDIGYIIAIIMINHDDYTVFINKDAYRGKDFKYNADILELGMG